MATYLKRSLRPQLSCEALETRICLTEVVFAAHDITVSEDFFAHSIFADDIDGDGDADVVASSYEGKIIWHENLDGDGTFGSQKIITAAAGEGAHAPSVYTADIDGDGVVDVLSAKSGGTVAWYENNNGMGSFDPQNVIATDAKAPAPSARAADIDGDGDMDVVAASFFIDKIAWYENTDGKGKFGEEKVINMGEAPTGFWANYVYFADVDGDGDADVLSATTSGHIGGIGKTAWHENLDGKGSFGPENVISTETDGGGFAADVDGDGDVDVLSASYGRGVGWFENTDGAGSFGPWKIISRDRPDSLVHAVDIDGDGDMDVLAASSHFSGFPGIAGYENTNGRGDFDPFPLVIPDTAGRLQLAFVADLNGDGDVDVLSTSFGKLVWFENLSPTLEAGDANRDSRFDQLDIVQVLQSAKYLTGAPATWEEGDWNGDEVFDQLDIVAALQTGSYRQ